MKQRREKKKGGDLEVLIAHWNGGEAEAGTDTEAGVEVVTGKEIEETGTGSERKKMSGVGKKREIMIRKEVVKGKKIDLEKGQKKGKLRVTQRREDTRMIKMRRNTVTTRGIPKKRESIVEVEAGKESIGVGAEAGTQVSAAEAGAKKNQVNIKMKIRRSRIKEVEAEAEEEQIVLRSPENEIRVPAKKNLGSVAEAKNVPTNMITVIARTILTNMIVEGAKVQNERAKKSNRKTKMRLCEFFQKWITLNPINV